MATMYDAVDPASIPSSVAPPNYTMGYVDGNWPSYYAMAAKYPNAIPVPISAIPNSPTAHLACGYDCEAGDYSAAEAAIAAKNKLAANTIPFIYCSLLDHPYDWSTCKQACIDIGVNPSLIDWGVAAYPGNGPYLYPGSTFHQYADRGSYDESVVLDNWRPGRELAASTIPTISENPMPVSPATSFDNSQHVFQVSYGNLWHKWFSGQWHNEVVAGPLGGAANVKITLPDQYPQVSIINNQLLVTIEDDHKAAFYFAQGPNQPWGVNQLP